MGTSVAAIDSRMNIAHFLRVFPSVRITSIKRTPKNITMNAVSTAEKATCPRCQTPTRRVHSHYRRRASDLPWQGVAVRLEVSVRRFFCAVPACSQRIFCERLPLVAPHAYRTVRLNEALQRISLALGGEGAEPGWRVRWPCRPVQIPYCGGFANCL